MKVIGQRGTHKTVHVLGATRAASAYSCVLLVNQPCRWCDTACCSAASTDALPVEITPAIAVSCGKKLFLLRPSDPAACPAASTNPRSTGRAHFLQCRHGKPLVISRHLEYVPRFVGYVFSPEDPEAL